MQRRDWTTWIVYGLGALIILWVASSLFSGWSYGGVWGMMKPEIMENWHRGHMGGGWGFGPLGLLFGFLGLMFRLGFLALFVLGGVWLFYRLGGPQVLSSTLARTCANCGQLVQSNWHHCPQCGRPLPHANDEGGGPEGTSPIETVHA